MPHFMTQASYTQDGIVGLRREGATPRLDVVRQLAASLGGSMEVAYWAFGETDFLTIVELPDNAAAAAARVHGGRVRRRLGPHPRCCCPQPRPMRRAVEPRPTGRRESDRAPSRRPIAAHRDAVGRVVRCVPGHDRRAEPLGERCDERVTEAAAG